MFSAVDERELWVKLSVFESPALLLAGWVTLGRLINFF